jgi:hypothetical protein
MTVSPGLAELADRTSEARVCCADSVAGSEQASTATRKLSKRFTYILDSNNCLIFEVFS